MLHTASRYGHLNIVEYLLDLGQPADINTPNKYGWTALHVASFRGHVGVARLLLDRGADKNVKDDQGKTPFDRAKRCGHGKIMELLNDAP